MAPVASSHSSISAGGESGASVTSGDIDIDWPFGASLGTFRRAELRDTAYEIFFMSCRSSPGFGNIRGASSIAYVGSSGEVIEIVSSTPQPLPPVVGPKGGTGMMVVTSRVKSTLGLKSRRPPPTRTMGQQRSAASILSSAAIAASNSPSRNAVPSSPGRFKPPKTSAEIMQQQMRVTDQSNDRLKKILTRSFVGQNGGRAETIILPLELLRRMKPSEFGDLQEYHRWQRRQLKVLEAGLLLHPFLPLDRLNASALRLREILLQSESKAIDMSKNPEAMRSLAGAVTSLVWRNAAGPSAAGSCCHWADGFPVNVYLYLPLLKSIFDTREETLILDEVDELLELIKKTWPTLGINRMIHNACFAWTLFQQYVATGQVEPDLIKATLSMLSEVAGDAKRAADHPEPSYTRVLSGVLASMQGWTEKRLLDYHENFGRGNPASMEKILSLALSAGRILTEDLPGMAGTTPGLSERIPAITGRVELYIQRSLRNAFTRLFETGHGHVDSMIVEVDEDPGDILIQLAKDTEALAANERDSFSPVLRQWCPSATGVALATLHNCFGIILKQYLAKVSSLTSSLVRVLHCASRLEKLLMQMVADDAADDNDVDGTSRSLLRGMVPFGVDAIAVELLKSWVEERLKIGREHVKRAKETENWSGVSESEPFTHSAVTLVKLANMTVAEFFKIPMPARDDLVHDLAEGLEAIFQDYANFVASCGKRQSFVPMLPPLTRCNQDSRLTKLLKKAKPCASGSDSEQAAAAGSAGPAAATPTKEANNPRPSTSRGTRRLYIRINTLYYLHSHIHSLDKSLTFFSRGRGGGGVSAHPIIQANRRLAPATHFDLLRASIQASIQRVSEVAAYRLIFLDCGQSFYGSLYVEDVAGSRIRPALRTLKQNLKYMRLEKVLTNRAQPATVKEVMRAAFEAFLMVLLAGGSERAFSRADYNIVLEDFRSLKRLFCSSEVGMVQQDVVETEAEPAGSIIELMSLPTEQLIEDFMAAARNAARFAGDYQRLIIPPTPSRWKRSDPNTVLRVICHRNDDAANNFLKRALQLPKRR